MTAGKAVSQAAHAAVQTSLACIWSQPNRFEEYQAESFGTKVCLIATHEDELKQLLFLAQQRNIPCALIEDSGHKSFFDGQPTITALGIGPLLKHEMPELKRLPLMK